MAAKKIALFIDADNISAKFGRQIIDELSRRGEIFIRRIYGNWSKISLHGWNECILNLSLRAVQQTDFASGKNATDMSLTIDAMDVLYGGRADVFALVSNDSDFTPLAIRLREGGMNVVGVGNSHVSNSFRMACSEFIDLDAPVQEKIPIEPIAKPVKKKSAPKENSPVQLNLFAEDKVVELKPQTSAPAQVQPVVKISSAANPKVVSLSERQQQSERDKQIHLLHELLHEVAELHGDEFGFTPLCWAGQSLREKNLGFGIRQVGYSSFRTFVAAFPKLYEVIHRTNGENFCYRCLTTAQISDDEKIRQVHDGLREAVKMHGDYQGFVSLCWTGAFLKDKNLDVKNLGYVTLQSFIETFSELYELQKVGTVTSFRCKADANSVGNKFDQLHEVLYDTAAIHGDKLGFVLLSTAGDILGKKNLDLKNFGYVTLQSFIETFPELYELQKVGTVARFRCRSNANFDSDRLGQLHDILRESAEIHADDEGFSQLNYAGTAIKSKNLGFGIKDFGYRQLRDFVSAFPDLYETAQDDAGQHFRYRPRQKFS